VDDKPSYNALKKSSEIILKEFDELTPIAKAALISGGVAMHAMGMSEYKDNFAGSEIDDFVARLKEYDGKDWDE
jgi:hypothetical protein